MCPLPSTGPCYWASDSPCYQPLCHICWNSMLWGSCQNRERKICSYHLPPPFHCDYENRSGPCAQEHCAHESCATFFCWTSPSCSCSWLSCCSWVSSSGRWWPNPFEFFPTHHCDYSGVSRACHYFSVPFWSRQPTIVSTSWLLQKWGMPTVNSAFLELLNEEYVFTKSKQDSQ